MGVVLEFLLLILNIFHTFFSSVPIVNFVQINSNWDVSGLMILKFLWEKVSA